MKKISRFIKDQEHHSFVAEFGNGQFDVEQFRRTPDGWMRRRIYCRNTYKHLGKWAQTWVTGDALLNAFRTSPRVWPEIKRCALRKRLREHGMNYKP